VAGRLRLSVHNAKLENSNRLQRVYSLLQSGPKTTMQIIQEAGVCAVNSIISELRVNGITIHCECIRKGVYKYSLGRLF